MTMAQQSQVLSNEIKMLAKFAFMSQKFHENLYCQVDSIQDQLSKYLTLSFHSNEKGQNAIMKS